MILNEYETIYVTRPDLDADEQTRLDEKFESVISKDGTILVKEEWGKRKLAYEIKKLNYGNYTYLNFVGPADIPTEIERSVRIEDNVIRFLTVKLEDTVDVEERRVVAEERQRKRAEKRAQEAESRASSAGRRGHDGPRSPSPAPRRAPDSDKAASAAPAVEASEPPPAAPEKTDEPAAEEPAAE